MDKSLDILIAQPFIERSRLGLARGTAMDGFDAPPIRGGSHAGLRAPGASLGIERLVLVSGSGQRNPALEKRAALIARSMQPAPRVIRAQREDDVAAMSASGLVLVDRKKPMPFIVPYLGRTAGRILRDSRTPLLVVAGMPERRYSRVVVAVDLETDITDALAAAKAIAPDASFTLLHIYRALFDGKLQWAGVPEADVAEHRVDAQREAARGMAALLDRHRTTDATRTLLRYGWPVGGVLRTSAELDADLIVVARNARSWWADALGASVSLELLQRADRDVLVVHAPGA